MDIEAGQQSFERHPEFNTAKRTLVWPQTKGVLFLLVGFSVIYFADVGLRASEKYFWYDEIFTIYVCRLPSFGSLWDALRHGMDFNPPLFFMLTKASQTISGEGLISTRLPQIFAFWILCLSLFQFVRRRSGTIAGFIAMLLPMLTTAFYYAYEARPYGIILGFSGLALVCWQMSLDRPGSRSWLVGFSACLLATFLLHCYALLVAGPFASVELFRTFQTRRIHWPMFMALITPTIIASATYVPLLLAYKSLANGTNFEQEGHASWAGISSFYLFLLAPCILLFIFALVLLASNEARHSGFIAAAPGRCVDHTALEVVLGVTFLALPILGVIFAKIIHGPVIVRYFLPALIGVCIVMGTVFGRRKTAPWVSVILALTMALIVGEQFGRLVWHRYNGWGENLTEPISGRPMNTTPGHPLDRYRLLLSEAGNSLLPVGILTQWDFVYLVNYAPNLRPRLYFIGTSEKDFYHRAFRDLRPWFPVKYNPQLTSREFCRLAPEVLIYGLYRDSEMDKLSSMTETGRAIKSLKISDGHFLAEMEARVSEWLDDPTRSRAK